MNMQYVLIYNSEHFYIVKPAVDLIHAALESSAVL